MSRKTVFGLGRLDCAVLGVAPGETSGGWLDTGVWSMGGRDRSPTWGRSGSLHRPEPPRAEMGPQQRAEEGTQGREAEKHGQGDRGGTGRGPAEGPEGPREPRRAGFSGGSGQRSQVTQVRSRVGSDLHTSAG